jgi:hypothetical protein
LNWLNEKELIEKIHCLFDPLAENQISNKDLMNAKLLTTQEKYIICHHLWKTVPKINKRFLAEMFNYA